jgi:hypothetical protein
MPRNLTAAAAAFSLLLLSACADDRADTAPGAPAELPAGEAGWDTLHPPVPPAPGEGEPGTEDYVEPQPEASDTLGG